MLFPAFDWIQVEVTTRCNAACVYCPRTAYRQGWEDRDLPLETFRRLAPLLSKTEHVHLQGWGEPLLHPDFFGMAAAAKAAGCRVGTTTNGMLMDEGTAGRLVESGIDVVAFSLAGTDGANDAIRKGTRLEKVLDGMRTLRRLREARGGKTPRIHVAYMLLRSGLAGLDRLPGLIGDSGAEQAVVSTLDFVPSPELRSEAMPPGDREKAASLLGRAAGKGVAVHFDLAAPARAGGACTENVGRAFCVASDGAVSPCVFTGLQAPPGARHFRDGEQPCRRLVFGDLAGRTAREIWRSKEYASFRASFRPGGPPSPCRGCPKLR